MALKSRSYILDFDCVKLSLGIFFFSELFNGEFFLGSVSGSAFLCQKHTKSHKFNVWPNFSCGTDSCVVPWRAL